MNDTVTALTSRIRELEAALRELALAVEQFRVTGKPPFDALTKAHKGAVAALANARP